MRDTDRNSAEPIPPILDPAYLWAEHKLEDKLGLTSDQYLDLCEDAYQHYDPTWPAHNFDHAMDVADKCMKRAQDYIDAGKKVNLRILFPAALLHDILYHEELPTKFATKERYSAAKVEPILRRVGFSDVEISEVQDVIISTEPDAPLNSCEKLILFEADMSSMGEEDQAIYEQKSAKYELESEESKKSQHKIFRLREYLGGSVIALATYFTKDLSYEKMIKSEWLERCLARTHDRLKRYAKLSGLSVKDAVAELDNPAVTRLYQLIEKQTPSGDDED